MYCPPQREFVPFKDLPVERLDLNFTYHVEINVIKG
jgi:hypothetical protein